MTVQSVAVRCKCGHLYYEGPPGRIVVKELVHVVGNHAPQCTAEVED